MKNLFVGIDPSLTETGLIILGEDAKIIHQELISTASNQEIESRLLKIKNCISSLLVNEKLEKFFYVSIEGLSFMSKGQAVTQLAGLHYLLRIFLYEREKDIIFDVIAPTALKKFVSGKGNVKKELILLHVFKKWGIEFENSNLADAYGLARMALEDKL